MNVTCFSVVPCRSKKLGGKKLWKNYGRLNTQKIIQFRKAGEDGYNPLNLRSKQSTVNHEHKAKLAKAASHVTGKKTPVMFIWENHRTPDDYLQRSFENPWFDTATIDYNSSIFTAVLSGIDWARLENAKQTEWWPRRVGPAQLLFCWFHT